MNQIQGFQAIDTTRRYPRSLAEAFPKDFADAIERPKDRSRAVMWIAIAIAVVVGVLVLFGVIRL